MPDGAAATIDERVLLARQPILDRDDRVIAYELLYRPIPHGGGPLDPVAATAAVIVNGLSDVGLDALVGPHPAYINVTREFLLGVPSLPIAPDRVVLELIEDQELDDALLEALRALVDAGFTVALDDFQYTPEQEPLVELAAIAKLDVQALSPERLAHDAALLKRRGLRLVAEKVETHEEALRCKALGFDAFQGYYFARPASVHGHPLPTTQITTLCPDRAFTVGLFSLLGALVKRPLPELLPQLPFDERTTAALLHGHEPEGQLLRAIVAHERGEELPDEFPPRLVARCYRAATSWSDSLAAAVG